MPNTFLVFWRAYMASSWLTRGNRSLMRHLLVLRPYGGSPQVGPINIGPQVFASHLTVGGLFDIDASTHRNLCRTTRPLMNRALRDAKYASKLDLLALLEVRFEVHAYLLFSRATANVLQPG